MATLSMKVIIFKSKIYILPHKIGLATFSMLLKITQTVAGLLKKSVAISKTLSVLLIRLIVTGLFQKIKFHVKELSEYLKNKNFPYSNNFS